MTRPTFDEVAFSITRAIAERSTCPRLHVAAVIMTPDHRLVASGYNGSLPGLEHCDDDIYCWHCTGGVKKIYETRPGPPVYFYEPPLKVIAETICEFCQGAYKSTLGCSLVNGHCVRTVHAEANAIAQAAKYGTSLAGCSIYILHQPCLQCTKLIVASGIIAIHYDQPYTTHDEESGIAIDMLLRSNVMLYAKELNEA